MNNKKIHFVIVQGSLSGICGLKHSNFITNKLDEYYRHSNRCEKCDEVLAKMTKMIKPNNPL